MQADITPEELETRMFTTRLRGYDPEEVRAYLADVAAMLRDHKKQADRAYQAVGEEMGEMLQQARDRADAMTAAAEAKAADAIASAAAAAETRLRDADAAAAATRAAAEEDAARLQAEAAEAAEAMRTTAQRDADERTARANERVRLLVAQENEARERIAQLRTGLLSLSERLQTLEGDGGTSGERTERRETPPVDVSDDIQLEPATEETATPAP